MGRFPLYCAIAVCVLLCLYLANIYGPTLLGLNRLWGTSPPPGVLLGKPLAWRTLDRWRMTILRPEGMMGGLVAGNFDTDPDEEVALIGLRSGRVYEADGAARRIALRGLKYMLDAVSWDFDGDGVDEVVPEPLPSLFPSKSSSQRSAQAAGPNQGANPGPSTAGTAGALTDPTETTAFHLNGSPAGTMPVVTGGNAPTRGDFDGDGQDDLAFDLWNGIEIYGRMGRLLLKQDLDDGVPAVAGDVDGDGRMEVLHWQDIGATRSMVLLAYGMGKSPVRLTRGPTNLGQPICCADIDGDGCAEIISSSGWLNPKTGAFTAVTIPPVPSSAGQSSPVTGTTSSDLWPSVAVGDYNGDGAREVVFVADSVSARSDVCVFDRSGTLIYHEVLPPVTVNAVALRAGGKDYLVVQLTDKLLIYP